MKKILSVLLAAVTLVSFATGTAYAYDKAVYDSIKNENVMSFKVTNAATGKETTAFAPGDEINITASMDSIWGDPKTEDDVMGYAGNVLPGAYGMNIITSCLVFPTENFTPKAGTSAAGKSTIANFTGDCVITKTSVNDAKKSGAYSFMSESLIMNEDEDKYMFFTGSGELCTWKLTVNEDAKPGTYKLPIGAYMATSKSSSHSKTYEFFGKTYADIGHADSQLENRPVKFTSPTGEHVNDDPKSGAYITVTVANGKGTAVSPDNNAMAFIFESDGKAHKAGDTVKVTLSVKNNEGLDQNAVSSKFSFDNTALQLVSVSTPIKGLKTPNLDLTKINNKGEFKDLGKSTEIDCFFEGTAKSTKDESLITLAFKVLPTAAGSATKISGSSNDGYEYPDATVKLEAKHSHKFVATVQHATCTAHGHSDTACSCGLSYKSEFAAKGHTLSADALTVAPTAESRGFTTYRCSVCHGPAKVVYTEKTEG